MYRSEDGVDGKGGEERWRENKRRETELREESKKMLTEEKVRKGDEERIKKKKQKREKRVETC